MSRPSIFKLSLAGLCLALVLSSPQNSFSAQEAPSPSESIATEVRGIFERCGNAVVKIQAMDRHGPLVGSGFFVDPNGTLYTSYTIGGESKDIVVIHNNKQYPAQRVVADPRSGIAILKVEAQTPFLISNRSGELRLASPVVAIGYPMDLPLTPSFGTVGGFDLKYLGRFFATTHIRANIPVQRGEGGAPLLNMQGETVGILISSLDSGSAAFVLPIAAAEKVHKDFLRFGAVRPGWMGVSVVSSRDPVEGSRARVHEIIAGGPAEKAGLRSGDILLQIGNRPIRAIEDVLDASFFMTAEDQVSLKISRADQALELLLQPTAYPNPSSSHTHVKIFEFSPP